MTTILWVEDCPYCPHLACEYVVSCRRCRRTMCLVGLDEHYCRPTSNRCTICHTPFAPHELAVAVKGGRAHGACCFRRAS